MMVLGSGFLMNGYIVGCAATGQAAIIDPGFDADKILQRLPASGLKVEQILLTHGHQDHIGALAEIGRATAAPARIHSGDLALMGSLADQIAGQLEEGEVVHIGKLRFEVRSTPGHTAGGISLVHEEMAFVGDALFAGSLGGTRSVVSYRMQRQAVAEKLLGLRRRNRALPWAWAGDHRRGRAGAQPVFFIRRQNSVGSITGSLPLGGGCPFLFLR